LTDVQYFQGSPTYLREVRAAVSLPLLRKDFVFDTYQLDEARAWGADCVLLIVAGLEKGLLTDLYHEAKHRLLDVLVEVHDEEETEFAVELGADMIGINNRDLRTFKTDLNTTSRLIQLIPDGVLRVSESALETAEDVRSVHSMGADAVLIGTAFCASPDIESKVREVMGR
jgi:indole-3-glycerol phosphate synthase